MHQVIHIFLSLGISLSFQVILSSDFCLTEQVSKITISASFIVFTCSNHIFFKIVAILALSA